MTSRTAGNLYSGIPTEMPQEILDTLVQQCSVRIERIVSKGQRSDDGFWYDQDQAEWVVVLRGAARLEFADRVVELGEGDHILIEAHDRHRVAWTAPDRETVWLAVFFGP